jgi:hypothetical protein
MTDDEVLLKSIKGINGLGEELLDRIKKLEQEVRGQKARLNACEQILTRQATARERSVVPVGAAPEKQSWWPRWIN